MTWFKTAGFILILVLAPLVGGSSLFADEPPPATAPGAGAEVSYRQAVWPILKRHCWGCHSGANPQGGLKLDTVADMLKGGESGPAFQPGKPEASLLFDMISGEKPEMPRQQPPLSPEKIDLVRRWIAAGAKDDTMPGDSPATATVKIPAAYKFPPSITSISLSADGKLAAAACRSEIVLVDVDGTAPVRRLSTDCDLLSHLEFSPDGGLLAAAGGTPGLYGEVRFFKVADGSVAAARRIGQDTLFRGGFAPDGKAIAVGGPDGAVHVVPVDPAAEVRHFELHTDWVFDVAYTPDGRLMVSAGRDKTTKVSSAETGQLLRTLDASPEWIGSVATDALFAVSTGRASALIAFEYKIALEGIEVTGDGNGVQPVSKRDQYAKMFEGPPQVVYDLATSADRKLLAVAGAFGEVRVYNMLDRQRVATIANVAAPVYGVALNADGTRLALGGKNGQLQVYELPSGKLLKSVVPVPVESAAK